MELLRPSRRRTILSETVYIGLNIAAALLVFSMVYFIGSPYAALGIVLLSKWRVIAVRPQYWYAHLVTNAIDIIVGISLVVFLTAATGSVVMQLLLTILYIAWLLLLKPRSKRSLVILQGAVGMVSGVAALMYVSYDWYASAVILVMWVIGFSAARHVLLAYNEPHARLFATIWGLLLAEIGWISYHWTIAYTLPFTNLMIAQAAIIVGFIGFMAERSYASYNAHGEVKFGEIVLPLLLGISSISLLLTVFNGAQSI